jgi:hypothetical protein
LTEYASPPMATVVLLEDIEGRRLSIWYGSDVMSYSSWLPSHQMMYPRLNAFLPLPMMRSALYGQRDFGAALTFDACSVSRRQFNFTSGVELTFVVLLDLPSSTGIYGGNGYVV